MRKLSGHCFVNTEDILVKSSSGAQKSSQDGASMERSSKEGNAGNCGIHAPGNFFHDASGQFDGCLPIYRTSLEDSRPHFVHLYYNVPAAQVKIWALILYSKNVQSYDFSNSGADNSNVDKNDDNRSNE